MKSIDVQELLDHAMEYLEGDEVLTVERDGKPIGYYLPTGANHHKHNGEPINSFIPLKTSNRERFLEELQHFGQTVQRVLDETGMTEEELSQIFDLKQPLPEPRTLQEEVADSHATGR